MTKRAGRDTERRGTTLHRALGDPTRVCILETLRASENPSDARALAAELGLHPNTVRGHLKVLAEAELVETVREGPARRGRPRILYRAAAELAEADDAAAYRLLARILASSLLASGPDAARYAEQAGEAWGSYLVGRPEPFAPLSREEALDRIVVLHQEFRFRPELRDGERAPQLLIRGCPLSEVAKPYQGVVCRAHLGLIKGALAELRAGIEAERLEPFAAPGLCVAHLKIGCS